MNLKLPIDEQDVDSLVREYLNAAAATVNVERLEREINLRLTESRVSTPAIAAPGLPRWRKVIGLASAWTTAAVVLIAISCAVYLSMQPEPAGAYALVTAAQHSMENGPDRCYRVEGHLPTAWLKTNPLYRAGQQATIWTRGNRYMASSDNGNVPIRWGQDEKRNFWFIAGDVGFSFRPGETPPILNRTRMFLSLNPRQLLNWLLKDFDLTIAKDRDGADPVVRVWAERKPESTQIMFDSAWIEIDPRSKLIRRFEVERTAGRRTAPFSLTFTFVEQDALPASQYQAESHLPAGGELFGPDQAAERDRRFREFVRAGRPVVGKIQEAPDKAPVDSQ